MNSLVVESIKNRVASGELPEANLTSENRFLELRVGSIDMRFKQVGKDGRTANYPTDTSQRYKNQLPLIGGPDALVRVRLTLGWRWNITATEIEDIVVVYAKGNTARWIFSILRDDAEGTLGVSIPHPTAPDGSGIGVTFPEAEQKTKGGA